jgi:AAA family ATP:ADP antiporter
MSQETESSGIPSYLTRTLGIRRDELAAVGWSFAYFFFILSAYYMLRPIRDTMAIDSGVETIPWLFTGTFAVMVVAAPIFGWIASRFPRKQFLPWVYYFFVSNILVFYVAFSVAEEQMLDQVWIGRAFFVWLSVFNLFVVTVFWSFMADIYSKEQSRRLFGVISAGGSTGAVLGPVITGTLVIPIGFQYLLPVSALLLLAGVYCIYRLRHWVRQHVDGKDSETIESEKSIGGSAFEGMLLVFRRPYFGMIALALLLANFVGVFTYTYLLELVQITFEGMDRHIQVLAWIDAAINVFSFIGQLVLVKISVRRIGIGYTLALLPIISAIGFAVLAINPVFIIMAVLQILRRSLTFGFSKPTNDMLYSVVSTEEKYKVKNFIETAIYRSGDVVGAWSIRFLSGIGITGTAIICIPIAIAWAAISLRIGREYRRLDDLTGPDQTPLNET